MTVWGPLVLARSSWLVELMNVAMRRLLIGGSVVDGDYRRSRLDGKSLYERRRPGNVNRGEVFVDHGAVFVKMQRDQA